MHPCGRTCTRSTRRLSPSRDCRRPGGLRLARLCIASPRPRTRGWTNCTAGSAQSQPPGRSRTPLRTAHSATRPPESWSPRGHSRVPRTPSSEKRTRPRRHCLMPGGEPPLCSRTQSLSSPHRLSRRQCPASGLSRHPMSANIPRWRRCCCQPQLDHSYARRPCHWKSRPRSHPGPSAALLPAPTTGLQGQRRCRWCRPVGRRLPPPCLLPSSARPTAAPTGPCAPSCRSVPRCFAMLVCEHRGGGWTSA
mmetsp:Transcript_11386/g.31079  ORF Transcript_11386/g.31079 Transcript_11386/m.31079 type:complete len:250 (+) Transcript_11386:989-1738(+)